MDSYALRIEILRFYRAYAYSEGHSHVCSCGHLANKFCVSDIDLDMEVGYLKRKGYLSGSYVYGARPSEGEYRITKQGNDFLDGKNCPKEEKAAFRRII
jgi:hypothetical protein